MNNHRRDRDEFSELIGTVYDAALDPTLWPATVEGACRYLDCRYGVIGSLDLLRSEVNFNDTFGYDPDDWQEYVENRFHENPLNPVSFRSKSGDVFNRSGHERDWQRFENSTFYGDFARRLGIVDLVQGTLDKTASGIAMITCARHESVGIADDETMHKMRALVPHFRRSILIGKTLDLRYLQASAFAAAIDALATGVFLVNPRGELVHANDAGQAMLNAREPISLVSGVLTALDAGVQAALQRAFAAAHSDQDATAGAAVALRGTDGRRFVAHVLPLTSGARRQTAEYYSAVAALFVREANVDLPAAIGAAAQLYGFTPTEEKVLRALVEVGGVSAVAPMLGSTVSTVKKHVAHLFEKTGTSRQAELVKLIAGFDSALKQRSSERSL